MGEEIPEETPPAWPPDLEDTKFYCATVDVYSGPIGGCEGDLLDVVSCCTTGSYLKIYWSEGRECARGWGLCNWGVDSQERVVGISGPFDTRLICQANCEDFV